MAVKTQNSRQNRRMIIVWRWNDEEQRIPDDPGFDEWTVVNQGGKLIRTPISAQNGGCDFLCDLIQRQLAASNSPILLFLHRSQPHGYQKSHANDIEMALGLSSNQLRIRLFGDGKGPIYCRRGRPLGILGTDGEFGEYVENDETPGTYDETGLVVDHNAKTLNDNQFDYNWNYYWHEPRKQIFQLAEDFRIWSFGYVAAVKEKPIDLQDYLQAESSLWTRLHHFGQVGHLSPDKNTQGYSFEGYHDFLKTHQYHDEYNQLIATHEFIGKKINQKVDQQDANDVIEDIYDKLISLYEQLPNQTL